MEPYSGRVLRDLSERRFNKTNACYCLTGGSVLGCPFLRTNKHMEKICTLYRSKLKLDLNNHYSRVSACKKNHEVPIIKNYIIHASKKIKAISPNEARKTFYQLFKDGMIINSVEEGKTEDYEDVF